jgi:hypothetical protein
MKAPVNAITQISRIAASFQKLTEPNSRVFVLNALDGIDKKLSAGQKLEEDSLKIIVAITERFSTLSAKNDRSYLLTTLLGAHQEAVASEEAAAAAPVVAAPAATPAPETVAEVVYDSATPAEAEEA